MGSKWPWLLILASKFIDLSDSHLTFVRENPDVPGSLQCGLVTEYEPIPDKMTYVVESRFIRIKGFQDTELVLSNIPDLLRSAILDGAEFWVANYGGSEDAFIAKRIA